MGGVLGCVDFKVAFSFVRVDSRSGNIDVGALSNVVDFGGDKLERR